ncbi:MAG TPA: DUF2934 domain-containing protein [Blastocatellia bacterium]|nr:DUF2934 domain-containing protein [Blastocatellia bacterium]
MSRPAKSKRKQEQADPGTTSPTIETPAAKGQPAFEQIQKRAYEIYLERGGAPGSDVDDWLQAERELGGLTS